MTQTKQPPANPGRFTVYAEGLAMGDKARSASLAEARSAIGMLATDRTLEVSHEAA